MGNFGVIFDMDGVISDTQVLHSSVESELLRDKGVLLSPSELRTRFAGVSDEEMWQEISNDFDLTTQDIQEMQSQKWERMFQKLAQEGVREIPGCTELVKELSSQKCSIGLASGSPLFFIQLVLSTLHLQEYFPVVVSAEEVERGKPEPDVFLEASRRMNLPPERCLVIEDARSGIQAAKKAAMKAVFLGFECPGNTSPDLNIRHFSELNYEKIRSLIENHERYVKEE